MGYGYEGADPHIRLCSKNYELLYNIGYCFFFCKDIATGRVACKLYAT